MFEKVLEWRTKERRKQALRRPKKVRTRQGGKNWCDATEKYEN